MQAIDVPLANITSESIRLRTLVDTDINLYHSLYTNADVMKYICKPLSAEQANQSFRYALRLNSDVTSSRRFLAICVLDSEQPIGLCSISHYDVKNDIAELGCMVLPRFHKNHIAKDALESLANYLSEHLPVKEFTLDIHPDNIAALRLALSMGYIKCPFRERIFSKPNPGRL